MTYYDYTAGKVQNTLLQCPHGVYIQVVGRLVQKQHIGSFLKHHGQLHTVPLAARQDAGKLLLVCSREVEPGYIGTGIDLPVTQLYHLVSAGDYIVD